MMISHALSKPDRRLAGFLATLAIHALLLCAYLFSRHVPAPDGSAIPRIQWINISPLTPLKPPPPTPLVAKPAPATVSRSAPARLAPAAAASAPEPAETVVEMVVENAPVPAPAPATATAQEMLQRAKRDIGKIDQELRKAYPGQHITAPVSNGATRLAEGLQKAADLAPGKWYEAPKVTEIIDPGSYSRRRYRVVSSGRQAYCITVESNHAPDGLDSMKNGIKQKKTNCEANEQSAKKQKW